MNKFDHPSSEEPVMKYRFTWQSGKISSARNESHEELEDAKARAVQLSRETGATVKLYQVGIYENIFIGQVRVERDDTD